MRRSANADNNGNTRARSTRRAPAEWTRWTSPFPAGTCTDSTRFARDTSFRTCDLAGNVQDAAERAWRNGPARPVEPDETHPQTSAGARELKNGMPGQLSGWIDLSIGELLEAHAEFLSPFAHVLITSLDSTRDIRSTRIGRDIMHVQSSCKDVEGALLVPGPLASQLHRSMDLFVGFDEIWCFDAMPDKAKPVDVSIAPPPSFDAEEPTAAAREWMRAMRCGLALSDGCGMNYVTPDAGIAAFLRSL